MHWFDEDTFDVVGSSLGADLGVHVLVVMTNRVPMSLPDTARAQVFELDPLNDDEADKLITACIQRCAPTKTCDTQRCVASALHRRGGRET